MERYYQPRGCPVHGTQYLADDDVDVPELGFDQKTYKEIVSRIGTNTIIQPDFFSYTHKHLTSGVDKVFGNLRYDNENFDFSQDLKRNVATFSGFKSAWQTKHARDAENDEQLASINRNYNTNYMDTEYVHTVRSSRSAKNWQRYEQDKDLYPYLEYMPSSAAEPRQSHKRLYGVIKSVDDSFWDTWMPPSDWGCKCGVAQRRRKENAQEPPEDIEQPPRQFRNNPGKSGKIIKDDHPMIGKLPDTEKKVIERETGHLYRKAIRQKMLKNTPDTVDDITIPKNGTQKALNTLDVKEWFILKDLDYFLDNAQKTATRLPNKSKRRNIKNSHFFRLPTEKELYALIWETKGGKKIFHTITHGISGQKK